MIVAIVMLAFLVWGYWRLYRGKRSPDAAAAPMPTEPIRRADPRPPALGLEDDAEVWPAARGPWTALDERQLVRLLTDAAPTSSDDNNPRGEHEDTP